MDEVFKVHPEVQAKNLALKIILIFQCKKIKRKKNYD